MRLHRPPRFQGARINIAPLIDVVFLLIIFSMTITQFKRAEFEKLELPRATQGRDLPDAAVRLTVNVGHDGRIVMDGREWSPAGLDAMLAEHARRHGGASIDVLLRGDRRVDWHAVREVMSACGRQGIGRVRLAVADAPADTAP